MDGFENQTTRSTRHSCTATSLPYPGENCVQPALFISPITSWYSHFRLTNFILGDPGADSGDEGKSKRAEKYGTGGAGNGL